MKTPVMEAEHAIDDCTAMSLYDCLIPKLREHRRFRIKKDEKFSIADFKACVTIRNLEYDIKMLEVSKLTEENTEMK